MGNTGSKICLIDINTYAEDRVKSKEEDSERLVKPD